MNLSRREFLLSTAAATLAPHAWAADDSKKSFGLGLVTYNVAATWDLPTILRVCKSVGIEAVECRTTHKHGVEPNLSTEARKDVKKQFADSGVVFWGCGTTCEFHSPDSAVVAKQIELCKQFVDLVAELGGKGVKVRPNGLPKGVPTEKTLAQIGKSLIPCGKAAEAAGIEIWVEVHGAGTQEPINMRKIMDECGHPKVGVTWNSNPTDVKNGSVAASFELLKPFIRSCHINDLQNDAAGKYPYRELFKLLHSIGYNRYTLIEVSQSMPDVAMGEKYLHGYKKLWSELKG